MHYLKPLDLTGPAGSYSEWLISPDEGFGCSIRVKRGGGKASPLTSKSKERVAVVFSGSVTLTDDSGESTAIKGDSVFIPANVNAAVNGPEESTWVEIEALDEILSYNDDLERKAQVRPSNDRSDFINYQNSGFWLNATISRENGSESIRMNAIEMEDKVGSPDWHIHAFAQMYLIQDGEMTVDIGRARHIAGPNTLVILPPTGETRISTCS